VRERAAKSLGQLAQSPGVGQLLRDRLADRTEARNTANDGVMAAFLDALSRCDSKEVRAALPDIKRIIAEDGTVLPVAAARSMYGSIHALSVMAAEYPGDALPELERLAADGGNGHIRAAAAFGLADASRKVPIEVAECFVRLLNSHSPQAREAAAEGASELNREVAPKVLPMIKKCFADNTATGQGVRQAAIIALGNVGAGEPQAVAKLLKPLLSDEESMDSAWKALALLLSAAPEVAVKLAVECLADPNAHCRAHATRLLAKMAWSQPLPEAAVKALEVCVEEPDKSIRDAARVALAGHALSVARGKGDRAVSTTLLDQLRRPDACINSTHRRAFVGALARWYREGRSERDHSIDTRSLTEFEELSRRLTDMCNRAQPIWIRLAAWEVFLEAEHPDQIGIEPD
jgi:hypothetical protein